MTTPTGTEAEVCAARTDSERLDWLARNTVSISGDIYVNGRCFRALTLRAAIDAAMARSRAQEPAGDRQAAAPALDSGEGGVAPV